MKIQQVTIVRRELGGFYSRMDLKHFSFPIVSLPNWTRNLPHTFFFSLNAEENGNLETFLIMHVKNLPRSFSFYIPRFIVYNLPAPYKYLPQTCPIKFTQIPPYHLSTLTLIRFIYYYEEHGEDFNHFHSGGCAVGQWRPRRQATQPHGLRLGLCGRHR